MQRPALPFQIDTSRVAGVEFPIGRRMSPAEVNRKYTRLQDGTRLPAVTADGMHEVDRLMVEVYGVGRDAIVKLTS